METIEVIDPTELSVLAVEAALRNLLLAGVAKHLVRLKGISEKWVGSPGWFLWFDDLPGAFLVELTGAVNNNPSDQRRQVFSRLYSRFRIKHYPAGKAEDPSFISLSAEEKRVRLSDVFDSTGTPLADLQDKIDEHFFVAGNICMSMGDGELHYFCACPNGSGRQACEYSDCCRPAEGTAAILSTLGFDSREKNWENTWNILDRLLLSFCYANKSEIASASLYQAKPDIPLLENLLSGLLSSRQRPADHQYIISGRSTLAAREPRHDITAGKSGLKQLAFCNGKPGQSQYSRWFNPLWWEIGSSEIEKEHVHFGCAHD
jgi:hypothetical protein